MNPHGEGKKFYNWIYCSNSQFALCNHAWFPITWIAVTAALPHVCVNHLGHPFFDNLDYGPLKQIFWGERKKKKKKSCPLGGAGTFSSGRREKKEAWKILLLVIKWSYIEKYSQFWRSLLVFAGQHILFFNFSIFFDKFSKNPSRQG